MGIAATINLLSIAPIKRYHQSPSSMTRALNTLFPAPSTVFAKNAGNITKRITVLSDLPLDHKHAPKANMVLINADRLAD